MSRRNRRRFAPPRTGEPCPEAGPLSEAAFAAAVEADPRTLMLCAQARRALEHAIAEECRDEAFEGLVVVDVIPAPSVRRLRVLLRGEAGANPERVLRRLAAAKGFLRSQVAGAIHRKRTPELCFELLPRGEGEVTTLPRRHEEVNR